MTLFKAAACLMFALTGGWAQAGIPVEHWTLPSGAQIYLVESPAIPMLDVQIDFDAGTRRDPAEQAGLASAMAGMMSKGLRAGVGRDHAPQLDENELAEAWADLGASFDAGASADRFSFSLRTLTYPELLRQAVALAARQMAQPLFAPESWLHERDRISAALREANTKPATVASRAFAEAVYGDHPYGADERVQSLQRIAVDDLHALHDRAIQSCRARVTLVGNVNRAQAENLVVQLLARLPSGASPEAACPPLPPVPEVQDLVTASERFIAFDSAQAHLLIGQPGFKRDDPDFFALTVGNYILGGGGFASRLTEEVRQKRGLSYSVYSNFLPGLHAGAFTVGLQTRPDQARQALQVVRDVLASFVSDGPSASELQAAKDYLVGSFALRVDSNRKLLANVSNIAWYGLPLDYLDTWTQRIDAVSAEAVRSAMRRKLQPGRMVTVVVGAQ